MKDLQFIETKKLKLPKDSDFLWKYFDIHKFIHLIKQREFRFTRMDQFEDPLEGIPLSVLIRAAQIGNGFHMNLGDLVLHNTDNLLYNTEVPSRLTKIHEIQKSAFVSCWFFEERESMAMWNLYSDPDGVAIKVPFGKIKQLLKPVENKMPINDFYCGRVNYQNFHQIDPSKDNDSFKVKKVALRKDKSFIHEKELRFVVRSYKYSGSETGLNSQPIKLKDLEIKIVGHPQMAEWKRNNIRQILRGIKLQGAFEESEIRLRKL
jgi:hypothetical protein